EFRRVLFRSNGPPVRAAKFFQRFLCSWRFALRLKHHAPVRRRKRDTTVLPARFSRGRRSHLIRCSAHGTIQLKNRAKSKPACSDGCRVRRGYGERRGSRLTPSFLVIARDLRENQRSMALRLPKQDYQDIERVIEL